MQVGDVVVCASSLFQPTLTTGRSYAVLETTDSTVSVKCDNGSVQEYSNKIFMLQDEVGKTVVENLYV